MRSHGFNGLLMAAAVGLAYVSIRELPDRRSLPPATLPLTYRAQELKPVAGPLVLAGSWQMEANDSRLGGVSALAIDRDRFLAVTDRGAVLSFDRPGVARPSIWLADLRAGPGPFAKKWGRDAESLAPDPAGRGWWVGFEQQHSLWLYDADFTVALDHIDLERDDWRDNRGAEGLLAEADMLLVTAENGDEALRVGSAGIQQLPLKAGAEIAEAATAPDGSAWLLLRAKGLDGISQSIAPLVQTRTGYRIGERWPMPKAALDNYEGMAITRRPAGGWRFWLVTDDGHRVMARTLLVALDLASPPTARHDKSPAGGAGLSKKPSVETP